MPPFIIVDTPFNDSDRDGIIRFGQANYAKYGVHVVYLVGELDGQFYYMDTAYPGAVLPVPPAADPWAFEVAPPVCSPVQVAGPSPTSLSTGAHHSARSYMDRYMAFSIAAGLHVQNIVLEDMDLARYGPVLRSSAAQVSDLAFRRIRSLDARPFSQGYGLFLMQGLVDGITIEDCEWHGGQAAQGTTEGVIRFGGYVKDPAINGGTGIAIRRVRMSNAFTQGADYPNMDFIVPEVGYDDGIVEHVTAYGCSDAVLDLKGLNWLVDLADFGGGRENLKLWRSSDRLGRIRSRDPRVCHVLATGSGGDTPSNTIAELEVFGDPSVPVARFEGAAHQLRINKLIAPAGQVLERITSSASGSRLIVDQLVTK